MLHTSKMRDVKKYMAWDAVKREVEPFGQSGICRRRYNRALRFLTYVIGCWCQRLNILPITDDRGHPPSKIRCLIGVPCADASLEVSMPVLLTSFFSCDATGIEDQVNAHGIAILSSVVELWCIIQGGSRRCSFYWVGVRSWVMSH